LGVWRGVFRKISNYGFASNQVFSTGGERNAVSYYAHPSVTSAVSHHLHYSRIPPSQYEEVSSKMSVYTIIDDDFWANFKDTNQIDSSYCMDYGDEGVAGETDDGKLLIDYKSCAIVAVDYRENRIGIIAKDYRSAFVSSYKVIRGVVTSEILNTGGLPIHASSIVFDEMTIAFVGDKGAGKSSSLLHLLGSNIDGISYLSNDKLLLTSNSDNRLTGIAWPTVASFGPAALKDCHMGQKLSPSLHLEGGGIAYLLLDLPLLKNNLSDYEISEKIRLTPGELQKLFGIKLASQAPLGAVILSQLKLEQKRSEIREVCDEGEIRDIIKSNIENIFRNHPDWLGLVNFSKQSVREHFIKLVEGFDFTDVRFFTAKWGKDFRQESIRLASYLGTKYDKLEGFRYHVGVYGLVTSNGRILLVQKTRGPYLGQLDLPGGSPRIGECKNETLHREMLEEVGCEIATFGPWHQIDFLVNRDSKNNPLKLRHFGSIREVKCLTEIDTNIFCEDVGGAVWIDLENWGEREDLSPLTKNTLNVLFPQEKSVK